MQKVLTKKDFETFQKTGFKYGNKLARNIIVILVVSESTMIDEELITDLKEDPNDLREFFFMIPRDRIDLLKKVFREVFALSLLKDGQLDRFFKEFSDTRFLIEKFGILETERIEKLNRGVYS